MVEVELALLIVEDFLGNEDYGTDGEVSYFKYINPPTDENGLSNGIN